MTFWKLLTRNCHLIIIGMLIDQMQHRAFRSLRGQKGQIWAPQVFPNLELHTNRRTNHTKKWKNMFFGWNGQTCKCPCGLISRKPWESIHFVYRSVESLSTPRGLFKKNMPLLRKMAPKHVTHLQSKDVRWGNPLNFLVKESPPKCPKDWIHIGLTPKE